MLSDLAAALALTLALELAFARLWGVTAGEDYKLLILVNILTNPAVNLLYALAVPLWGLPALPTAAALELAAVLTEGLCCRSLSTTIRFPLLFVLCANAFSFCAGALLLQLF